MIDCAFFNAMSFGSFIWFGPNIISRRIPSEREENSESESDQIINRKDAVVPVKHSSRRLYSR